MRAHVGQRRLGVHTGVGLHGGGQLAHRRDGGLRQVELAGDQLVALDHFVAAKRAGRSTLLGVRLDDVRRGVDTAVHRAAAGRALARLRDRSRCGRRAVLEARHVQGVVDQLVDALVLRRAE